MVFAELVEASRLGVRVSINEGTDVVSVPLHFLSLLRLEEIGL